MAKMGTSIPGTRNRRRGTSRPAGFTLVELSVVLFVLGLILWLAAPRLASLGEPDRAAVFRDIASESEAAFDIALFEKRETRLVIDPRAGAYLFRPGEGPREGQVPKSLGSRLVLTGIRIENEDRPLDIVTEIRYLPGGKVPASRLFFRDVGAEGSPSDWTLRIDPFDGSVDVLEGAIVKDA
jgi:prepilin-type N-terminal cleavage/methylation domain-containing protein